MISNIWRIYVCIHVHYICFQYPVNGKHPTYHLHHQHHHLSTIYSTKKGGTWQWWGGMGGHLRTWSIYHTHNWSHVHMKCLLIWGWSMSLGIYIKCLKITVPTWRWQDILCKLCSQIFKNISKLHYANSHIYVYTYTYTCTGTNTDIDTVHKRTLTNRHTNHTNTNTHKHKHIHMHIYMHRHIEGVKIHLLTKAPWYAKEALHFGIPITPPACEWMKTAWVDPFGRVDYTWVLAPNESIGVAFLRIRPPPCLCDIDLIEV